MADTQGDEVNSADRLGEYDAEIDTEDMDLIASETFEHVTLRSFFNLVYARKFESRHPDGLDFYHAYVKKCGNFDIEVRKPLTNDPPPAF